MIVYRRRKHQIDLFVWPTPIGGMAETEGTIDGCHARHWEQDGFVFWAVSDLNDSELDEFVRRCRAA
ncbi:MAG: hypothetical protein AB7O95_04190 [Geminicoccaceae bacterium]